jgi:hypothetical protein
MSNGSEGKDVLSSLPRSRPERRSAKRDGAKAKPAATKVKAAGTPPSKPPATRSKPAASNPKAKAKPKVAGSPRPSAATRRARAETVKPPPPARPAAEPAPGNRDIVATTVQAAGELARIGITVGTQIVREATRRLPRP